MQNEMTRNRFENALTGADSARMAERLARRVLLGKFGAIHRGELQLDEGGLSHRFGAAAPDGLTARVRIETPRAWRAMMLGGTLGAAEAYMRGEWTTPDLTAVVRVFARNRQAMQTMDGGLGRTFAPLKRAFHWLHRNTRTGSRRNIGAHYDLSNELFALFLDPTMTYSSAVFARPEMSLEQAQAEKYDRLCKGLRLSAEHHLLEIGTGWGGMAMHAARHYGCRVTTTTISENQFELARQRIEQAGLSDRIRVLKQDYRDLQGCFDAVVSVEMIEAVGLENLPTYFDRLTRLVKPGGRVALQAITIDDREYEAARHRVDFIQRYIFPGGALPSVSIMTDLGARQNALRLVELRDYAADYAQTLREWRRRFEARLDDVRALGFDDAFIRMWRYYLCYCEGGFEEKTIGLAHVIYERRDD